MSPPTPRATDSLAELLKATDSAFGPLPPPSDLAGVVRRRAKRRGRQRVAGIVVVLIASLGIAALLLRHPERPPVVVIQPPAPPTDPRELETQLRQLRAQADTEHATLERWRRSRDTRRRLERVHAALHASTPSPDVVAVERERAALILLDHADRLRRELNEEEAARAAYRRTIELFPDTRWAAVARQRMEQTPT